MNAFSLSALADYWQDTVVGANLVVFMNIFGALLLGLMVGYERSYRGRAAGMRTYGMVCMASCALTVVVGYPELWFGGHDNFTSTDPTRLIQGIVTGIGFLGAGVIMRDGLNISGLTTAASIWLVAAIGVLTGIGFYTAAILSALLATSLMVWGTKLESLLPSRHAIAVTLYFHNEGTPSESDLHNIATRLGYEVARGSFSISENKGKPEWRFIVVSLGKGKGGSLIELSRALSVAKEIESFQLTHARN